MISYSNSSKSSNETSYPKSCKVCNDAPKMRLLRKPVWLLANLVYACRLTPDALARAVRFGTYRRCATGFSASCSLIRCRMSLIKTLTVVSPFFDFKVIISSFISVVNKRHSKIDNRAVSCYTLSQQTESKKSGRDYARFEGNEKPPLSAKTLGDFSKRLYLMFHNNDIVARLFVIVNCKQHAPGFCPAVLRSDVEAGATATRGVFCFPGGAGLNPQPSGPRVSPCSGRRPGVRTWAADSSLGWRFTGEVVR